MFFFSLDKASLWPRLTLSLCNSSLADQVLGFVSFLIGEVQASLRQGEGARVGASALGSDRLHAKDSGGRGRCHLYTVILGTGSWTHWCGLEGACPHLVTLFAVLVGGHRSLCKGCVSIQRNADEECLSPTNLHFISYQV